MALKKIILSVFLAMTCTTNYAFLGDSLFSFMRASTPNATAPDTSNSLPVRSYALPNRRSLNSIEKIDVAYKVITAVNILYHLYSTAKTYAFPSQEEKSRSELQRKAFQIFIAKDAFNECLIEHRLDPKNARGIPDSCEQAALEYAMVAGVEELNKMVKEFKVAYGQAA